MRKAEKIQFILDELEKLYPQAECALHYSKPYELLIATRLSAQCTDERVNKVTPALFEKYTTLEAFAEADFDELCEMVHSCGFFRAKAKSIIEMSRDILERFDGRVPDNIEDLTSLSGIGRKTANLICGDIYGKPAIIADTHCIRLSNRLGLATSTNPEIVERQLKAAIPPERQTKFCHNLVHHGRAICDARKPDCAACPLTSVCVYVKKKSHL
ncbi:MAG: endonuclease III [Clostridia bacterium]|nr:endonuclease III [Clostridia bacterium]